MSNEIAKNVINKYLRRYRDHEDIHRAAGDYHDANHARSRAVFCKVLLKEIESMEENND